MPELVKVAKKSEIPEDTGKLIEVSGQPVALFRIGDDVYAISAICPHQGGPLDEGGLNDGIVTCPWHGWDFNVKTGACTFNSAIRVPVYKVKQKGEDVYVEV